MPLRMQDKLLNAKRRPTLRYAIGTRSILSVGAKLGDRSSSARRLAALLMRHHGAPREHAPDILQYVGGTDRPHAAPPAAPAPTTA